MKGIGAGRTDLPLKGDATSRFLPWLVAPMVFLSAVALAAAFLLYALIGRWDRDVSGTLTVEIAAAPGDAAAAADKTHAEVETAIRLLKDTPGVIDARALPQAELAQLLAPWLGDRDLLKQLPLPALIDVSLRADDRPDLAALAKRLAAQVPDATLDDHRVWLLRLIDLSRTVAVLAIVIVALIGAVTSATVVYATRTGMAVHREVIEVLHLIGATDDYIARQFAGRAFVLGLEGGIVGLVMTAPVQLGLGLVARHIEGGFLSDLAMPPLGWAACAVLPVAAAILAMVTARLTVHGTLARML